MVARLAVLRKRLGLDPAGTRMPPRAYAQRQAEALGPHPGMLDPYAGTLQLAADTDLGQNDPQASRPDRVAADNTNRGDG